MQAVEIHGRRVVLAPLCGRHAGELVGLLDDDLARAAGYEPTGRRNAYEVVWVQARG